MKKFTKELGPGWITLVENDDYALSRLIFGDGLEGMVEFPNHTNL